MDFAIKQNKRGDVKHFAYGEDSEFKCSECGKEEKEGFYCRERRKFICNFCQLKKVYDRNKEEQKGYPMHLCPHEFGEHMHIKIFRAKQNNENNNPLQNSVS